VVSIIRLLPKLRFLISEELHFQSFASSEIAFFAISEELYYFPSNCATIFGLSQVMKIMSNKIFIYSV